MAVNIETGKAIIRISRDSVVEESAQAAVRILDQFTHIVGQIIMVRYVVDESLGLIDNMVAIGIKEGIGPDCYQIITPFNKTLIWGILKTLPETDVANFPTGREKYIFLDPGDGIAKYVTLDTSVTPPRKSILPITDGPRAYEDISTGRTFYLDAYNWSGGGGDIDPETIRQIVLSIIDGRIDQKLANYFTKAEVNDLLDGKVDKAQGAANAGKYLTVGIDGNVQLTNFELNWVEL